MDDQRLHDLVRDSLRERAGEADTSADVVERVAPPARPRRALWVAGGAALAVAATVVAVALAGGRVAPPDADPPPAGETQDPDPAPDEWRTEYWRDVQVDVPADWWFGGGLMDDATGRHACFPEPMVSPAGRRVYAGSPEAPGYVGRPIYVTDVCLGYPFDGPPEQPYLWFDAPLEPGTVDLGGGWVQETVEVNGSGITVATRDAALRKRILSTATGGETCLANRDDLADPLADAQPAETEGAVVCAYQARAGEAWLSYAATLDAGPARTFVDAFEAAPAWSPAGRRCDLGGRASEWVVVTVDATAYVVHMSFHGCAFVDGGDRMVRLTPELVAPWATGGIPAVVYGPTGGMGGMIDGFIGRLG